MIVANISITLKNGILDPQGKTILRALESLQISPINAVRAGKLIRMTFEDISLAEAERLSHEACRKLLANPVIEDYAIDMVSNSKES